MSRLIDADALKQKMCDYCENIGIFCNEYVDIMDIIDDAPTVETEPIRHGKWSHIEHDTIATRMYLAKCSLCGFWAYAPALYENSQFLDYCPNCGAKMDGGAE